jgi:ATP-dependent RNA helicase DDX55/SPB4
MRNPYVVEIKTESHGIFAAKSSVADGVMVKSFDTFARGGEGMEEELNNISEIPQNLTNHYLAFENQAQKLRGLQRFLTEDIKGARIIIFFATCASVNFHFLALQLLFPELAADIFKLHGKIDQKKRSKIYREFKDGADLRLRHRILLTTDLSSRGIDIPDVDWIIQYDPPQWSDSFVHRIGRTARAGRHGNSILFLTECEVSYIAYLQKKKVDIREYEVISKSDEEPKQSCFELIREAMLQDRDLIDKAQDAFVSFIRYYREHQLNFIFSITMLDMGQVANSFCLFKIPRVKEVLGKATHGFEPRNDVDLATIPYKDSNKGLQKADVLCKRREKLARKLEENEKQTKIQSSARYEKKAKVAQLKTTKRQRRRDHDAGEWDDLQKEERNAKKLKSGKITKA